MSGEHRGPYNFYQWQKDERAKEAQGKCEQCGKKRTLVAHHLISVYIASRNPVLTPNLIRDDSNMVMLCHDCHEEADEVQKNLTVDEIGWLAWSLFDLDPEKVAEKQWSTEQRRN
jgi:hypothetical protein